MKNDSASHNYVFSCLAIFALATFLVFSYAHLKITAEAVGVKVSLVESDGVEEPNDEKLSEATEGNTLSYLFFVRTSLNDVSLLGVSEASRFIRAPPRSA